MRTITLIKRGVEASLKFSTKPLIVSAGMPRSGSTLLFNILREVSLMKWPQGLVTGWSGNIGALPKGEAYLVKTHNLGRFYRLRASHKFYSYRDVRVAAISYMRKCGAPPTIDFFHRAIRQYEIAKASCDVIIKYDELVHNAPEVVSKVAEVLNIPVDVASVTQRIESLAPPTDITAGLKFAGDTLLHGDHFTGTKDEEWRELLPEELKNELSATYSWWFQECGYPLN